jgi:predicted short-subunit dehydrogenase-like oxidoreductase (DUF2520 family)
MTKPAVALIGAGSAGSALALALHREGYPISAVASRSAESAQQCATLVDCAHSGTDLPATARLGEVIIIATPDGEIENTCNLIAQGQGFANGQLVLHLSGALTSDALSAAQTAGADILSLHPVQTMVAPEQSAELLKQAWFCLEGEQAAIARGTALVDDISAKSLSIDKDKKALYHTALSLASNYLIALESVAVDMLAGTGIARQEALSLILPLIRGSVDTLVNCGLPDALTGPISRGDVQTIEKHLRALDDSPSSQRQIYRILGLETLRIAQAKGKMTPGSAAQIEDLLRPVNTCIKS